MSRSLSSLEVGADGGGGEELEVGLRPVLRVLVELECDRAVLRFLRGLFGKWPDFMPGSHLYRMALYLGREYLGSVPKDLADEDPEPGKWELLPQRHRQTHP
jgi:hypothetical protein